MKSITVKLNIQPEIFNATCEFMDEKGLDIEQELSQSVNKLYSKHVPLAVRKYIEKTLVVDAPTMPTRLNEPLPLIQHTKDINEKSSQEKPDFNRF